MQNPKTNRPMTSLYANNSKILKLLSNDKMKNDLINQFLIVSNDGLFDFLKDGECYLFAKFKKNIRENNKIK